MCEVVLTVQHDFGDRTNRKHARIKYTVENYGADWYPEQVNERLGTKLEPARSYKFHAGEVCSIGSGPRIICGIVVSSSLAAASRMAGASASARSLRR